MGCDGIWEQWDNDEMVQWVYEKLGDKPQEADLGQITTDLLHSQISPDIQKTEGKGCDNMSTILIVLKK